MGWDYAYKADTVPLSNYCTAVRIVDEVGASKRGQNIIVPYRHGEYTEPVKWSNAVPFGLECVLRYTNASGVVTHGDGAAGHVYENLAELKQLLQKKTDTVILARTIPHVGNVEGEIEVLEEVHAIGPRFKFLFVCRLVDTFWKEIPAEQDIETTITTSRGYNIAIGGNAPIGDMVVTFDINANTTDPKLALDAQGDYLQYTGALVNTDQVVFDVGARTCELNGVRADAALDINRGWWMEFPPDTASLALTATAAVGTDWDVTIDWNNKWR